MWSSCACTEMASAHRNLWARLVLEGVCAATGALITMGLCEGAFCTHPGSRGAALETIMVIHQKVPRDRRAVDQDLEDTIHEARVPKVAQTSQPEQQPTVPRSVRTQ